MFKKFLYFMCVFVVFFSLTASSSNNYSAFENEWHELLKYNESLTTENHSDIASHFRIAIAYANLGEIELAADKFDFVCENHDRDTAVEFLNKLNEQLNNNPMNHLLITQKAFVLFTLQNHKESVYFFDKSIASDQKNIWLYNYKALSLFALVENEEAKETLKESLQIYNNKYTHALLGYIFWTEGKYMQATYHFAHTGTLFFTIKKRFL